VKAGRQETKRRQRERPGKAGRIESAHLCSFSWLVAELVSISHDSHPVEGKSTKTKHTKRHTEGETGGGAGEKPTTGNSRTNRENRKNRQTSSSSSSESRQAIST
jgi:hypothetical protein